MQKENHSRLVLTNRQIFFGGGFFKNNAFEKITKNINLPKTSWVNKLRKF